ncbi:MAG TPA: TetR/AcrR family transcriptional regulator [Candidatus Anoxymicrobiaceae bacterium]|jgi:AcrR family transcriptional regulator
MARVNITDIRRREIIDGAYKVFSEKGYHNTAIADIAAELGVGHGTLYRYFRNKLDIATSVIDDIIVKITEVVVTEPPEGIRTLEEYRAQLGEIGTRFFELLEDNPELHKFLFFEALSIDESVTIKINAAFTLFAAYTEMYLKNGIKHGYLRPDIHTQETSYAINAMLFEAARRLSLAPEINEEMKEAWSETIVGLMLDGLAL